MTRLLFTQRVGDVQQFLDTQLERGLLQPDGNTYFMNGDKLTVDRADNFADYDPIHPADVFHSKISMRVHQWLAKGYVKEATVW